MGKFYSDEDVAKMEAQPATTAKPRFFSDEQVASMEVPHPAEKSWGETALDALPAAGTVAGSALGSVVAPFLGTVAGGAAGNIVGSDLRDLGKDYFGYDSAPIKDGPERGKEVLGNAAVGALSSLPAAGLNKVGAFMKAARPAAPALGGYDSFAAKPAVEATESLFNKGIKRVSEYLPWNEELKKPLMAVTDAKKGIEWIAKNSPESLGKFANVIKNAAATGSTAIVDFMLTQKNPEYQQLKKDLHDQ